MPFIEYLESNQINTSFQSSTFNVQSGVEKTNGPEFDQKT